MTIPPSKRTLVYAEDLRPEDVHALETFLNVQLGRVYEEVCETGETSFAMRSLLILVCDSAGLLHTLLAVERPETWQRAAIVREWQRLRSTAHEFNHCEGYDHDRWRTRTRVLIFSAKILSRGMPCPASASSCDWSSWVRLEHLAYPMRMSAVGVSGSMGAGAGVPGRHGWPGPRSAGVGTRRSFASRGTFVKRPVW